MSKSFLRMVTECAVRHNLHHGSNHYLIAIYLDLAPNLEPKVKQRAWKNADPEKILKVAKELAFDVPGSLTTESEINIYLAQIT